MSTCQQLKDKTLNFLKMGKNIKRQVTKEDIEMNYKHLKRCSITLVIRKMQIKVTIIKHFLHTGKFCSIRNLYQKDKCCWEFKVTGTFVHF